MKLTTVIKLSFKLKKNLNFEPKLTCNINEPKLTSNIILIYIRSEFRLIFRLIIY